jgi:hypothetical protein
MQEVVTPTKDLLDILVQVLVLVIPIVLSWFIRTYVRSSAAENNLAAITRLSNSAIDYVENLDKRGDLALPPEVKKGGYKLKLASQWLESELQRVGIKMDDEQAGKWVASEFQKRVGGVQPVATLAEVAQSAVELMLNLDRNRLVRLPPEVDRVAYLAGLGADWAVAQSAKSGVSVSRDEALIWVRAELLEHLKVHVSDLPALDRLSGLAEQAIEFVEQLKADGRITVPAGATREDIETDLMVAWLLTEAAREGLVVTSEQIVEATTAALLRRRDAIPIPAMPTPHM